jgi:hypothetical protein
MWVGARHFAFVRVTVFYVALIWLLTLVVPPVLVRWHREGPAATRLRLAINYVNRNFYQQILFFVLPIYYASATRGSVNMIFVALLAVSALLSTLDVVYDRHLSTNRDLAAVFFALNLFACLTAALPILWHVGPALGVRASAALAFLAFVSFYVENRVPQRPAPWVALIISAVLLASIAGWGQRLVPPVPMRLAGAGFGDEVERSTFTMARTFGELPAGWSGTLELITAIRAPMGVNEAVRHRWLVDGTVLRTTDVHQLAGGRTGGFRLWTALPIVRAHPGSIISVDVETAGGQLIGRAVLKVASR